MRVALCFSHLQSLREADKLPSSLGGQQTRPGLEQVLNASQHVQTGFSSPPLTSARLLHPVAAESVPGSGEGLSLRL